jgi:hypothetical protein
MLNSVPAKKNENTQPTPNLSTAAGNSNEIRKLKNQCEKDPSAIPLARILVGNISERITQITAPCETAKNAM